MAPALLGVSVAQLSLLVNLQIASYVAVGAVSWLNYADRLMEFPTALLGVALGVVLTPQLSAAQARDDVAAYSSLLDWGLRMVVLLALPCAAALVLFAEPMVAVLFHRGAFHADDVRMTTAAVMGYGVGLMGIVGVKVAAPGYYARQDMRTPVRIAVIVLVLTQVLNLIFVGGFHLGVAGLSLSIGLAAVVNASWLLWGLHKLGTYRPLPGWSSFALRVVVATAALSAMLAAAAHFIDWIALGAHELLRAGAIALVLGGAALVYFAVLRVLGLSLKQFIRR
jgi:putative peptidoglycan lipid II flippase